MRNVLTMLVVLSIGGAAMADVVVDPKTVATANNDFAMRLYQQVAAKEGNTFVSPASISTALAMTALGARGQTEKEMYAVLALDPSQREAAHQAYAALMKRMNEGGPDRPFQLAVANRLWGQKGFAFLPAFLDETKKWYGAGLEEVDFMNALEPSRQAINAWVEKQTQDKIKELIKQRIIDSETRLVLTNAIYFKAAWADQFKPAQTKDEPFLLGSADQKVDVPMMHRQGSNRYGADETMQVVELPYVRQELSMVVFLPKKVDGLAALEKKLADGKAVAAAMAELRGGSTVKLALPKWKMRSEFELSAVLANLGMRDAFSRQTADFSGMTTQERLCISKVIHQTFIDVNEEGTEAAAATAVVMMRAGMARPIEPVEFKADHPFVYVIRDNKTGAILFMGRVANPKG